MHSFIHSLGHSLNYSLTLSLAAIAMLDWLFHTTNKNKKKLGREIVQCLQTDCMEFSTRVSEDSRLYCNFQASTILKTHFFSMTFICVDIFNSFLLRLLCRRRVLNANTNTGRVLIVGWVVPKIGQAASDVIRTVNGWRLLGVLHSHQQVVHMRSGYT